MQLISLFLDIATFEDFLLKNTDFHRKQRVFYMIYIFFGFFKVRCNCTKFHRCSICVRDFKEEGSFWAPSQRLILNWVKLNVCMKIIRRSSYVLRSYDLDQGRSSCVTNYLLLTLVWKNIFEFCNCCFIDITFIGLFALWIFGHVFWRNP